MSEGEELPAGPEALVPGVLASVLRNLHALSGRTPKNRRNFSGCGCAASIRINPALRHPAGNGSRFPGVETPHPPSSGREVAPRAQKAAGLASEGGWTISDLGLSSLSRWAVPGSPHLLPVLRKPAGAESARGEN